MAVCNTRMCAGCRERQDKFLMLRVVKQKDGSLFVDTSGKASGRGAYLCKNPECLAKLRKNRALERSFKCKIDDEIFSLLGKEMTDS